MTKQVFPGAMAGPKGPRSFEHAGELLSDLDMRSRAVFRLIVENFLATGEPLGSRSLSRVFSENLSAATIRNVMSDLEHLGLVFAPHTSAGRLPTEAGMRFFVDSFLEIGDLSEDDRRSIDAQVRASGDGRTVETILTEASHLLSGLTRTAGLVASSKRDIRLRQIEFVRLEPAKALVVIVGDNGGVENRVIDLPPGTTPSSLTEAANYLNSRIAGLTLGEARSRMERLHNEARAELDALVQRMVDAGLAVWAGAQDRDPGRIIVSGHANLLADLKAQEDLARVQQLFGELEERESLIRLLDLAEEGEGVRIFIGADNRLFSQSGSSLIVAPYRDENQRVIGALGIIGPTRLNYARIVPMIDYTAEVVGRMLRR
ncbi:MAG: heat-inducible transcriptional repressor HrcA [Nitratireductor sp.]|nr:heat-inducible transcriptional repressor HrcA [Nitratireductor sp.]